jgi:hypothetical protein
MRIRPLVIITTLALLGAACAGGDDDRAETEDAGTTTSATPTAEDARRAVVGDYTSAIYGDLDHWLCHPQKADDPCDGDLDATVVEADGSMAVEEHRPAADPPIDCFYAYPTISSDQSMNSDLSHGPEEAETVRSQAARLSSECRLFAPVYRQITVPGLLGSVEGDRREAGERAYADVADAWQHYLANDNGGRGVVLIGHSQGSGHLNRLIRENIDDDKTQRELLVSAFLIGSAVRVPPGADVGGDFENVPLCRRPDQVGCVVSFASFRSTSPPPEDSFFGRPRSGEGVAACNNPAALAGGEAELHNYFASSAGALADGGGVDTPWVSFPGLLRGECVERDGFSYLEVTVDADPADARVDDIPGDLSPEWGLHVVDVNLVMGDICTLVRTQAAAHGAA